MPQAFTTFVRGARVLRFSQALAEVPKAVILRVWSSSKSSVQPSFILRVMKLKPRLFDFCSEDSAPVVEVISSKRDCSRLSVERKRAKRRVQAAARMILPQHALPGYLYLYRAIRPALTTPWDILCQQIVFSLKDVRCYTARRDVQFPLVEPGRSIVAPREDLARPRAFNSRTPPTRTKPKRKFRVRRYRIIDATR